MAEDGAPSAKRLKTAQVDANDVITFHFLDARKEPTEISEASSFPPDMCHQFFGDDEVGILLLLPACFVENSQQNRRFNLDV